MKNITKKQGDPLDRKVSIFVERQTRDLIREYSKKEGIQMWKVVELATKLFLQKNK